MKETVSQSSLSIYDEIGSEISRGNHGFLRRNLEEEDYGEIDEIVDRFQCVTRQKREITKRSEELSWAKHNLWKQEQKNIAARLEKQLKIRWEFEELIEEQLHRFQVHYLTAMVPTRLKDISEILLPKWTPPHELAAIAWFGDWRPSAILVFVQGLLRSSISSSSTSGHSSQCLSQLIHEFRIEEAIVDEEMAEIQATSILHLPFAPLNANRTNMPISALASIRSEFRKIERVITKAQHLRFKALEMVLKKVLSETDAAEFLVAFEGSQDKIHQLAKQQRFHKGPVSVPIKGMASHRHI